MPTHDHDCCCLQCLSAMADALDAMETMAIAAQIQASWDGCPIDDDGPCLGYQPWLPTIPTNSWHLWFATQDADRRSKIRTKVAARIEAEQLLQRT